MKKIGKPLPAQTFTNQVEAFIKAATSGETKPVIPSEGGGLFRLFESSSFFLEVSESGKASDVQLYLLEVSYVPDEVSPDATLFVKYANVMKEGLFLDIIVFPSGCSMMPDEKYTPLESTPVDVVVLPAGCHVHVVESGPLAEFAAKASMITRFLKEMKQHLNLPI